MLRHCVLLTWKHGTSPSAHDRVIDELEALPGLVPSIRSYEVTTDGGLADGNADVAVIATFDDETGWRAYSDHPEHVRVITDHIRPILAGRAAHQTELDD